MDLIFYSGLNCHLASIINIAALLGAGYTDAYATLWSETDFTDEVKYGIYVSKRVFINLTAIGVRIEPLGTAKPKVEEALAGFPVGELLLVGMDTFLIPWHPVFGHFRGPHYFFAQKDAPRSFLCFDPIYNERYKRMESADILAAFELSRVYKTDAYPPEDGLTGEAGEVLRTHTETRERLLDAIARCGGNGKSNIVLLIKQIGAMINNRYLFRQYFRRCSAAGVLYPRLFGDDFFSRWEAVRNGLYKAMIMSDNKSVITELRGLLDNLFSEEISMAKEIIKAGQDNPNHE